MITSFPTPPSILIRLFLMMVTTPRRTWVRRWSRRLNLLTSILKVRSGFITSPFTSRWAIPAVFPSWALRGYSHERREHTQGGRRYRAAQCAGSRLPHELHLRRRQGRGGKDAGTITRSGADGFGVRCYRVPHRLDQHRDTRPLPGSEGR